MVGCHLHVLDFRNVLVLIIVDDVSHILPPAIRKQPCSHCHMDSLVTDVDKQYEMAALGQSKIWQYNVYGKTPSL